MHLVQPVAVTLHIERTLEIEFGFSIPHTYFQLIVPWLYILQSNGFASSRSSCPGHQRSSRRIMLTASQVVILWRYTLALARLQL